jgi:phospholipid/cholesterol/gamma-HCH transport system substrate-binding protein
MNRNVLETVMGALVLAVALIFLAFAYSSAGVRSVSGYELTAKFDTIGSLKTGSDVRVNGVKVGSVTGAELDPKTFQVDVRMTIDPAYRLPVDTVAAITSSGLLGDEFMKLEPGADDKELPLQGGKIASTVPPADLMKLLGSFAFSGGSSSGSSGNGGNETPQKQ